MNLRAPGKSQAHVPDGEIEAARLAGEPWAVACLNCGSALSGHFCSECGQRAVPPYPTMHELAGEAFSEFSGWDGKVAATAKLLVKRPGALTCEFLAGRRARYIQPLRLYLTFSVAFFLLAASSPSSNSGNLSINSGFSAGKEEAKAVSVPISGKNADMTPAQREKLLSQVQKAPWYLRPMIKRVANDPKGFQKGVFEAMPKGLFVLLPVFAGVLALFFPRRHYSEHIYFALHLHSFAFLALTLNELLKFTRSVPLTAFTGALALVWIFVYAHLALRRVYGDSHGRTLLKELGISALYLAASIPTIIGVALWVAAN